MDYAGRDATVLPTISLSGGKSHRDSQHWAIFISTSYYLLMYVVIFLNIQSKQ